MHLWLYFSAADESNSTDNDRYLEVDLLVRSRRRASLVLFRSTCSIMARGNAFDLRATFASMAFGDGKAIWSHVLYSYQRGRSGDPEEIVVFHLWSVTLFASDELLVLQLCSHWSRTDFLDVERTSTFRLDRLELCQREKSRPIAIRSIQTRPVLFPRAIHPRWLRHQWCTSLDAIVRWVSLRSPAEAILSTLFQFRWTSLERGHFSRLLADETDAYRFETIFNSLPLAFVCISFSHLLFDSISIQSVRISPFLEK